jgi:hypothetical protein
MVKYAVLILLASATQAFACPELTGNFTCQDERGQPQAVQITQADKNGSTVYMYNGSEILTDNHVYPIPDDDTLKQGTFRGWCDADKVMGQVLGQYYSNGLLYGDLTLNMELSLSGTDLVSHSYGDIKNSTGKQPFDGSVTCKRN